MIFERGQWLIELCEDYSQFFDKCNWYTFRFAFIELENDAIMGAYELTFIILGLGIRIRWDHTETDEKRELRQRAREIKAEFDDLDE